MPVNQTDCVIIADDLTGACDSAVHFTAQGANTVVRFRARPADEDAGAVEAFTTDTRDTEGEEVDARIGAIAAQFSGVAPRIVFKKIDSLLRGNPGREIISAFKSFNCETAVITPAYPELGRTVRDGHLHVGGDSEWEPLHLGTLLGGQELGECLHVEPKQVAAAMERARFISVDATCDADLDVLTTEAIRSNRRILWVGSGGLASALAKQIYPGGRRRIDHKPGDLPVLFCVGSEHPVTLVQLAKLRDERATEEFSVESCTPEKLAACLRNRRHAILRISRAAFIGEALQPLFREVRGQPSGLLISGGDTASRVCSVIRAEKIQLEDQVVPGVPWGSLKGGQLDGTIAATKSGAFGWEDTLVRVADFFTCLKN